MRNLSANAIAAITNKLGNEPINLIAVRWVSGGTLYWYADKDIPLGWYGAPQAIPGRILDVGELDAVINVSSSADSQELDVILDDTNGSIKTIMDTHDIHKREAWVYQWFEGLDWSDLFLLFKGVVSSPITWKEGDRTVSFSIITALEDKEVGFSPEEGQFEFLSSDVIGQPWPMCFGTCVNVQGLQVTQATTGILRTGVAIRDFALDFRQFYYLINQNYNVTEGLRWDGIYTDYMSEGDDLETAAVGSGSQSYQNADAALRKAQSHRARADTFLSQRIDALNIVGEQHATELEAWRVIGGEQFPRGNITLRINQALFPGHFDGDSDTFIPDVHSYVIGDGYGNVITTWTWGLHPKLVDLVTWQDFDWPYMIGEYKSVTTKWSTSQVFTPSGSIGGSNLDYFYAKSGSEVQLYTVDPQQFIISITPGTVLKVSAYRKTGDKGGVRELVDLPSDYYTVSVETYGSISATIVKTVTNMAMLGDGGWENELYVTFESTVGPNTVDIMEYLIDTYTELTYNTTSFNHVKTRLASYPSHFIYQKKTNLLTVLREIAWQARCSIRLINDVFYLTYLPEVPTSAGTVTESDIDLGTFELDLTPTESLITEMDCKWTATGAQSEPNRIVLRHNISKYGKQSQEFDFYIYNFADAVIKSGTFWLIRYSNTWKRARFSTSLNLLNVEPLDGVTLAFSHPYIASANVLAIAEQASYNSDTKTIDFDCWCPVKAGQMTTYDFAYPADVDETLRFPAPDDVENESPGDDAGGWVGDDFDVRYVQYGNQNPYGIGERRYQDRGDPKPSDTGDVSPGTPEVADVVTLDPNLLGPESGVTSAVDYSTGEPFEFGTIGSAGLSSIDLQTTTITNSAIEGSPVSSLGTFFHSISPDGSLAANGTTTWTDGTNYSDFFMQYDIGLNLFGAGLAFLYE